MGPLPFIVFGALVVGMASAGSKKPTVGAKPWTPGPATPAAKGANKWGLMGCDPFHTPSGTNQLATPSLQTHADYQWCYVVRDGDTPGDVAAMVLGPDQAWRYVELLTANPEKAIKGSVIAPEAGDAEMNFQTWDVGEIVRVPRTWNPWIDQTGSPRGETAPYMPPAFGYGAAA